MPWAVLHQAIVLRTSPKCMSRWVSIKQVLCFEAFDSSFRSIHNIDSQFTLGQAHVGRTMAKKPPTNEARGLVTSNDVHNLMGHRPVLELHVPTRQCANHSYA